MPAALLTAAQVEGFRQGGIASMRKHFAGSGTVRGGRDDAPSFDDRTPRHGSAAVKPVVTVLNGKLVRPSSQLRNSCRLRRGAALHPLTRGEPERATAPIEEPCPGPHATGGTGPRFSKSARGLGYHGSDGTLVVELRRHDAFVGSRFHRNLLLRRHNLDPTSASRLAATGEPLTGWRVIEAGFSNSIPQR